MYAHRLLLFGWIIGSCAGLQAQTDLVPNGDFESFSACPIGFSCIEASTFTWVDNWLRPSEATSDYFHECASGFSEVSIPENYFFTYQFARSGAAYGGFYAYLNLFLYREYLQVELTEPMEPGTCYYVEFWVAPAEQADFFGDPFAIDEIGMYISNGRITVADPFDYSPLDVIPQIVSPDGFFLSDTLNWMKISGIYVAEGGEDWITIGNFKSDADTETEGGGMGEGLAYYGLDDVSIISLEAIDILPDTILCAGDILTLTPPEGADLYIWNTGDTSATLEVFETGTYIVEMQFPCGSFFDTAEVVFSIDDVTLSSSTIEVCYNAFPFTLEGSDLYDVFNWSTGATTASIEAEEPGTYVLSAFGGCASFVDTFIIVSIEQVPNETLPDTVLICEAFGTADIFAPPFFENYLWSTGENTPAITVGGTGFFTVDYSNSCDAYSHTYTVITDPYLELELNLPEQAQVCPFGSPVIVLNATNGFPSYQWNIGAGSAAIEVTEAGVYTVEVTTYCRTLTDSTIVTTCEVMSLPNAFSPNNDGINDLFSVICNPCDGFTGLYLYNRWGELVFETNDPTIGWDGIFNEKDAEAGAYVYLLTFENGSDTPSMEKGSFILIR
ncbi:MAG TPA: hypothetical protein DHW15_07475 [Bacteroidetes bacterium]|jgi:gliding motility-associated-like protein|nr:MAG: hypothetical protein ABR95_06720 [Sphingobacteriales bacterium BACL12 MAG-120813-bin55]HCK21988.1 hypothetical protein [Bacteroidota bacterium]